MHPSESSQDTAVAKSATCHLSSAFSGGFRVGHLKLMGVEVRGEEKQCQQTTACAMVSDLRNLLYALAPAAAGASLAAFLEAGADGVLRGDLATVKLSLSILGVFVIRLAGESGLALGTLGSRS